ncbi:MAG: CDP-alcohol phosphatidyltransferase family protein [Gemmatimonadota bacterium]
MTDRPVYRYVPYFGYPQDLPTASGEPLTVVLDATDPHAFDRLWGMTLLERNLRTVERLGGRHLHLLVRPADAARARRRRFEATCTPALHPVEGDPGAALRALAGSVPGPVLLLDAAAFYDRRLVAALWQHPAPAVAVAGDQLLGAPAVLLAGRDLAALSPAPAASLADLARSCLALGGVQRFDLLGIGSRVSLLRKNVPARVIPVRSRADLREADAHLKALAGKGVNDLVGEFVHPPIEFLLTRLAARTPLTPNQISYLIILLSLAGLYYFAVGQLWVGIAINLVRGVADGVDGKLARLTMRESKAGNLLDHGTDTVYLPLLFLALGWGLSQGDPLSAPAIVTGVLQGFYWLNRVLASWFKLFFGVDESEFRPIDRAVRRIYPKRNIFILMMILAMLIGRPAVGLYATTALTVGFTLYRLARLDYEGRRLRRAGGPPAAAGPGNGRP